MDATMILLREVGLTAYKETHSVVKNRILSLGPWDRDLLQKTTFHSAAEEICVLSRSEYSLPHS
jgi:hypothetical protein